MVFEGQRDLSKGIKMDANFALEDDSDSESKSQTRSDRRFSYGDIAAQLIKDKLLLTALELHAELLEAGKEVSKLRDFFSNPANFEQPKLEAFPAIARSSSQATLDSLDMTRLSEDGVIDDRVAVLEFELRKARETINALRNNLTVVTSEGSCESKGPYLQSPIKPHEQRALNYLINEYLLVRHYKLTSITFADENEDQDFEDWDDVGLNMPKPADLLHLYRVGIRQSMHYTLDATTQASIEMVDECIGTEDLPEVKFIGENKFPEDTALILNEVKENDDISLSAQSFQESPCIEVVDNSISANVKRGEVEGLDFDDLDNTRMSCGSIVSDEGTEQGSEIHDVYNFNVTPPTNHKNYNFEYSGFESEVWSRLGHLTELQGLEEIHQQALINILGSTVTNIVHCINSSNKEEWLKKIVPLLVCMIEMDRSSKNKDYLMHVLLNLRKRPTFEDRSFILSGLVRVCEEGGEDFVEVHLLPVWSELMNHKYPEKRLLVAEGCAHISQHLTEELRDSLIVSILQQLLDDRDENVRSAAVLSLAAVASLMTHVDKYFQIESLALKMLHDSHLSVVQMTENILLPVTARWSLKIDRFHSKLLGNLIKNLETHLKNKDVKKSTSVVNILCSLLPHLVMFVASSSFVIDNIQSDLSPAQPRPGFAELCKGLFNPLLFYCGPHSVGVIMSAFDFCLKEEMSWDRVDWVVETMVPHLLDQLDKMDCSQRDLILSYVRYFKHLYAGFGPQFLWKRIKAHFLDKIDKLEKELVNVTRDWPSLSVVPVYVLGILVSMKGEEHEIGAIVEKFLVALGVCGAPLDALHLTVYELSKIEHLSEVVASALWQGVVHPRAPVRCITAELLTHPARYSPHKIVTSKVLPALITLATDPDVSVKVSTISVFSLIMENSSSKEVLDKVRLQVHSIVNDPSIIENHSALMKVVSTLGQMAPHVEPNFRDDVVIGGLSNFVRYASDQMGNETRRQTELVSALVEAFSNTIYSEISKNCINTSFLPALRILESVCHKVLPSHVESVGGIIKEAESRVGGTVQRSPSTVSLASVTSSNVGDMKQKISKIIQSPISKSANLSNLPGMFWKK